MKIFFKTTLFILLLIATSEVSFRVAGYKNLSSNSKDSKIQSEPDPLFEYDSIIGYEYRKGTTKVTLNNVLEYTISIDSLGNRVNANLNSKAEKNISIFGCSFFGGMGLNDNQTLSYHINSFSPSINCYNFSIAGHGMTSQILKLKNLTENGFVSDWAVFEIASFHLQRNVGAFNYIKNFFKITNAPMNFVTAQYNKSNDLEFILTNLKTKVSFLDKHSSMYHTLKVYFKKNEFDTNTLISIQNKLINHSFSYSIDNNIKPLFVVITNDLETALIIEYLKENNYPYIVSEVDYNNDAYNLNPYDQHPNEKAHKKYAEEIFEYICIHESCH